MNAVAEELTGWTQAEAYRKPLPAVLRLVQESNREPVEDPIEHVRRLQTIAKLASNTVLLRKDGSEIIIDDSGAPIRDRSGELTGFVLVFRDVTMARKSQAALIANEKLAVSGRLAASIAHEIHNPLDSVANLLYLMDQSHGTSTPEESANFLALARQEITRVTQISRAMLGLYRESREPVAVDLRETIESVLLLLERRFNELKIDLSLDLPQGTVVHGFPAELRQVFTNLIANAAEAVGQGGRVGISITSVSGAGDPNTPPGFLICISDNGPGIPEELRARLFQPFFTTKGERGTGLGLWVSRGIVVRHSGDITIESDTTPEHRGTTIRVFLAVNPVIQPAPVQG